MERTLGAQHPAVIFRAAPDASHPLALPALGRDDMESRDTLGQAQLQLPLLHMGSWRSPLSPYLKYTWEFVEVFCKGTLRKPGKQTEADISAEEFKSWASAHWKIPPEHRMKRFGHPAIFPEELVERFLKLFSYRADIVLDPFNGAGTTTFVARQLGRTYLGIELSEEYCRTATQRLTMI